jgi:hypothetical protein
MQHAQTPILHAGEIMVHDATHTIGQVVDTIHSPDNELRGFEQVLQLLDGTRQQFRLAELRPASLVETRPYVVQFVE